MIDCPFDIFIEFPAGCLSIGLSVGCNKNLPGDWNRLLTLNVDDGHRAADKEIVAVYSAFISLHPTPVWLTDLETSEIVDANQAASDLFGRDITALTGIKVDILSTPENVTLLREQLDRCRRNEPFCEVGRFKTVFFDATDISVSWLPTKIRDRQHALCIAQDDNAQVALRWRLRATENMLRIMSRLAQFGGWSVNSVDGILHITEQTAAILEMPDIKTLSSEDGRRFVAPEFQQKSSDLLTACLTDGTPFDEVLQLVTMTGKRLSVRSLGEAVRGEDGQICGAQGAFLNIDPLVQERSRVAILAGRLHRMLDSMAEGFIALSPNLQIDYLNPRAEAILGKSREVVTGMHLKEVVSDGATSAFSDAATRVIERNTPERMDFFLGQSNAWYRLHLLPTPEGVAIYLHDVTVEIKHAKRLRLLQAAVDGQHDMLEITEAANGIEGGQKLIYVNAAFEKMTGYTAEEVIGSSPHLHNGPLTNPTELVRIRDALENGTPAITELVSYRKDGSIYLKKADLRPIRNNDGEITNWVSSSRDITARRAMEKAIQDSEDRFRLVGMATRDVIWDRDCRVNRSWWNDALFQVFGHDNGAPEVQSPDWWQSQVHSQDVDRIVSSFNACLASRDQTWEGAYRLRRKDGSYANVTDRAYVSRNADGDVVRVAGCLADVTEQMAKSAQILKSQKLEAFSKLTGGIAHDFNNLLTVIIGNAELLAENHDIPPQLARTAKKIILAGERGSKLTAELLSFAREQTLVPRRVNLNLLLKELEPGLRAAVSADKALHIFESADLWDTAVDADQLKLSVLNIARNACDAMTSGGTLSIETRNYKATPTSTSDPDNLGGNCFVQLTLRDDGHGILPEHIDRIFDPFFTTKPTGKGKGIGLSMVHGFVKQSGGHIRVDSAPERGTAFHIFFPSAQLLPNPNAMDVQKMQVPQGNNHILMVEDDPMVSSYVCDQITELGYRVTVAANAAEALDLLKVHKDVDLLFTDIVMPGTMNGWQLAETVAVLCPSTRILMTSGYSDAAVEQSGGRKNDVHILAKPYRRIELAVSIRNALRH